MLVGKTAKFAARTILLGSLSVAGFAGLGATAATAAGTINCTAAGTVQYQVAPLTNITSWTIDGTGSCLGDLQGTYALAFTGTGTSNGAGQCSPNQPTVQNLNIHITGTFTNVATHVPKILNQNWSAPFTSFPGTTPFQISGPVQNGSGSWSTRIFQQCAPKGTPVAYYAFGFTA